MLVLEWCWFSNSPTADPERCQRILDGDYGIFNSDIWNLRSLDFGQLSVIEGMVGGPFVATQCFIWDRNWRRNWALFDEGSIDSIFCCVQIMSLQAPTDRVAFMGWTRMLLVTSEDGANTVPTLVRIAVLTFLLPDSLSLFLAFTLSSFLSTSFLQVLYVVNTGLSLASRTHRHLVPLTWRKKTRWYGMLFSTSLFYAPLLLQLVVQLLVQLVEAVEVLLVFVDLIIWRVFLNMVVFYTKTEQSEPRHPTSLKVHCSKCLDLWLLSHYLSFRR